MLSVEQHHVCENSLHRNEAGGSEAIREAVKRLSRFFRDVDVGWERSEPYKQVYNKLPTSSLGCDELT